MHRAVDQLQLTTNGEKTVKTHGFKVPKGTALKSALRKTGEKAKAQISRDRSSSSTIQPLEELKVRSKISDR
jgi:hypothetical protein